LPARPASAQAPVEVAPAQSDEAVLVSPDGRLALIGLAFALLLAGAFTIRRLRPAATA